MALAAAGDTWGIDGTTFLGGYAVLAIAVFVAAQVARRSLTDPTHKRPAPDLTGRHNDIAYLNGGADLAVCSALSRLRLQGLVSARKGTITAVGRPAPGSGQGSDELERAIAFVTTSPTPRSRISWQRPVRSALDGIERRLVAEGLLLSDEQRNRVRRVGLWMVAVAGLGLLRLLAGIAGAKPVGFLVVELLVVAVVAVVQLVRAPRRSRSGDRALAALRGEYDRYAPAQRPNWTVYGPEAAALGVGLFGASALWASDPAMAEEFAVQRAASGSSSSGSSCGGGDSGGGSSCGGGGGCGGGGCGG
ncbi:TIGR04222 domain-containing membrane protein [Pseudonocardia sp. CA-107938]|uniref:TIGR04222 domain-containing membrane protein n=1 Tax=Pseudonocardia sp. CA-107938 TaxID=3240021 RepID=UPI003D8B7897